MPYTAKSFAEKHNHKLTGKAASTAARMATGMEREGMDAGKAIRIADSKGDAIQAKRKSSGPAMSAKRKGWGQ